MLASEEASCICKALNDFFVVMAISQHTFLMIVVKNIPNFCSDCILLLFSCCLAGSVPVVTLNRQRAAPEGWVIPDAWHHQMAMVLAKGSLPDEST